MLFYTCTFSLINSTTTTTCDDTRTHTHTLHYRPLAVTVCCACLYVGEGISVPSFTLSNENSHPSEADKLMLLFANEKQSWKLTILRDGVYHIKQKKQEAPFYLINSFSTTECRVTTEMFILSCVFVVA